MASKAKSRRRVSDLVEDSRMDVSESERFFVKSANNDFSDRQSNIFGGLNDLEAKHLLFRETMQPIENPDDDKLEIIDEIVDDKFKVPVVPVRKSVIQKPVKCCPDYVLHPEKWTKYSLADVTDDQMSDKSNYSVALSFLTKRKRSISEAYDDSEPTDNKVIFRAPKNLEAPSDKSVFQAGKWVMPEYVVGKKSKLTKKTSVNVKKAGVCKAVELAHLNEEEAQSGADKEKPQDLKQDDEEVAEIKTVTLPQEQTEAEKMEQDEIPAESLKFRAFGKAKRSLKRREEND